ncbi:BmrU protein, partial [Dysosmobacter welbionis]
STRVRLLRQITDEATRCKGSGWLAFSCLLLHPAGPGLLCGGPVPHHRLIQPPAAGEVIAFEPLLGQNTARDIAPQAALADNVHRLAYRDFPQPLPQVIHREVNKALRVAVGVLAGGPHVQQRHTAVPGQGVHILREELLHQPMGQVLDHKACHVHRILGGGVGRRVGQIQILQLEGGESRMDGRGQHVDPLVHTLVTHDLRTQQAVCALLEHHLQGHDFAAGIVSGVTHGGEVDLVAVDARLFCRLLIDAGGGDGHIEYLDDGAALGAGIPAVSAADVVRRDAPLLVGGARQGEEGVLPGDEVLHLHRIPHSVDVRRGGLHPVVHQDA